MKEYLDGITYVIEYDLEDWKRGIYPFTLAAKKEGDFVILGYSSWDFTEHPKIKPEFIPELKKLLPKGKTVVVMVQKMRLEEMEKIHSLKEELFESKVEGTVSYHKKGISNRLKGALKPLKLLEREVNRYESQLKGEHHHLTIPFQDNYPFREIPCKNLKFRRQSPHMNSYDCHCSKIPEAYEKYIIENQNISYDIVPKSWLNELIGWDNEVVLAFAYYAMIEWCESKIEEYSGSNGKEKAIQTVQTYRWKGSHEALKNLYTGLLGKYIPEDTSMDTFFQCFSGKEEVIEPIEWYKPMNHFPYLIDRLVENRLIPEVDLWAIGQNTFQVKNPAQSKQGYVTKGYPTKKEAIDNIIDGL